MASRRRNIRLAVLLLALLAVVAVRMITHAFSPRAKAERILAQVARCNRPMGKVEMFLHRRSRQFHRYRGERSVNILTGYPGKIEVVEKLLALGPDARPALIEATNDPDPSVRICAMRALADGRDPRAFEILIAALDHQDDQTRAGAMLCLGKLKDPRALEPLVEKLKGEDSGVAVMALEWLGDPRAIEPLIETVGTLPGGAMAMHAVSRMCPERAAGALTDSVMRSLDADPKHLQWRIGLFLSLPVALGTTAEKIMLASYAEAPASWRGFANSVSVQDF